jgi:hypothetical protein
MDPAPSAAPGYRADSHQRPHRARCNVCGEVIESRHPWETVQCSCRRLALSGGPQRRRVQWTADPGSSWTDLSDDAEVGDEARELWVKAYQGEVLGEAYFAHLADHTDDPDHRAKLEALTALERCTREILVPVLQRLGIRAEPDLAILAGVAAGTDFDYHHMLEVVPPLAAEFLESYMRLRPLAGAEDVAVVDQLIAHELALELFAMRERAGDTERSLQPIRALGHVTLAP